MSLKVVLSFILKNESNLELHVVPMYLFESFEILKKYVRNGRLKCSMYIVS